jgi:hypothetical protein
VAQDVDVRLANLLSNRRSPAIIARPFESRFSESHQFGGHPAAAGSGHQRPLARRSVQMITLFEDQPMS